MTTTTPRSEVRAMQKTLDELTEQAGTLTADRLRQKSGDLHAKASALADDLLAKQDKTDEDYDTTDMALNIMSAAAVLARSGSANTPDRPRGGNPNDLTGALATGDPASGWFDVKTGQSVPVFGKGQSVTEYVGGYGLSVDRAIRGMALGDWSGANAEQSALSGSVNASGGFLVPDELSSQIVDLARNRSVALRLGAQTVLMGSADMRVAKVTGDPAFVVAGENETITESTIAFGSLTLVAKKLATIVSVSNELLEDAVTDGNFIAGILGAALAVEIDRQVLFGSGSAEINGIANQSGVQTTTSVGSVGWDALLDARKDLLGVNATPTGWTTTPVLDTALRKLKVNSEANHYSSAPSAIADLPSLVSNQVEAGTIIMADWSQMLIGVRRQPMIEFSRDAGFSKDQTKIRITWRGDAAVQRPNHVCVLTGATA